MPPVWQAAARRLCGWNHPAAHTKPAAKDADLQRPLVQPLPPLPAPAPIPAPAAA